MPWRYVTVERPPRRRRRVWAGALAPTAGEFVPSARRRMAPEELPAAARRPRRWDGSLAPPEAIPWNHHGRRRRRHVVEELPEVPRRRWRYTFLPSIQRPAALASIVFTARASADIAYQPGSASARIVFAATGTRHSSFLVRASSTIVFTARASQTQTHAGDGVASIVFTARALWHAPGTVQGAASARIVFTARARGKRPGAKFGDGYLGRYQVGQDVPLQIQCVDSNGDAAVPDGAPVARLYRDGAFVRAVVVPAETDPDVTGRFRGRYTLGDGDAPGHYGVVYLYGTLGLPRGDCTRFEVVAGGDPSGPVLSAYSLQRPEGDYVLAHLSAGRLASGQTPYLDEGI